MNDYKLGLLKFHEVGLVLSDPKKAKVVIQTLKAFFASADESITVKHVPRKNVETSKEIIVEEATKIWSKMKTLGPNLEMPYRMTHDGFLKYLQLRKPSISKYDVILMDGVEDCTPAFMDIILRQKCGLILAGDPHQQIYTFRGADNTVFTEPVSRTFYLTQSFRFGYGIAYVGATFLDIYKEVRNKTLVGNNQDSEVIEVHMEGKVAHLSWTNKTVLENAMNIIKNSSAKIHFLGGGKSIGLGRIRDLWKLLHPELRLKIQDSFIRSFQPTGFTSIKEYAEKAKDKKLEDYIAIVEKYQDIPKLLKRIKNFSVETADYILGTVHKAKGLEFDTVQIDDDFLRQPVETMPKDKLNLLYIAFTRAKKRLILSRCLAAVLKKAKVYYVRFELATAQGNTTPLVCSEDECHNSIPADSLLIPKRINFVYTDSTETSEGFLCPSCTWDNHGPIAHLAGSSRMEQVEVPPEVHILLEDF
uniref:Uncharacterized protein n=1 Tax=Micrurus surinamensis TaxID=129470 RepID=A0A2D4P3C0_MICSU